MARGARAALLALALAACSRKAPAPSAPPGPDPIAHLRAFEEAERARADFATAKPQDAAFGADPYRVVATSRGVARAPGAVGLLRGENAIVRIEPRLPGGVERLPTPRSPSALAIYRGPVREPNWRPGDVIVGSELEPVLGHYRLGPGLTRLEDVPIGVTHVREIVSGDAGEIHVLEEHDGRLLTFVPGSSAPVVSPMSPGPARAVRAAGSLVVASVLGHSLEVFAVDSRGVPRPTEARATIDGPFWSLAAQSLSGGEAIVVAGGVEDHPLDRRGGFFGYVDSFVYVYRLAGGALTRTAVINVGERGLLVPKAIAFAEGGGAPTALVTSYGSDAALELVWADGAEHPPTLHDAPKIPPGLSDLAALEDGGFLGADPLLDAWVRIDPAGAAVTRVDLAGDDRSPRERLGEALFFTNLMAPASSAEGAKSRFTCETCHFEGYGDGRVHHTGRGEVRAATKPLVGLFNNRPYFSRALDPDLASVAENEFRVAGAPSPSDPHFTLTKADAPWLGELGLDGDRWDPAELRLSLMAFLMAWNHRTNPRAATPRTFTALERAGAEAFRDRCEGCHEARTATDIAGSRVPFERWERAVFEGGTIVWAKSSYAKTGVEPYVHESGARIPSLRRLYKKRPYLTNGRAPDLRVLLERVRVPPDGALTHQGSAVGDALEAKTVDALLAFLDLL